ncbi:MAG: PKD domain-containing protein [Bacteroidota bacterium]
MDFQQFYDHTGEDFAQRLIKTQEGQLIMGGYTQLAANASDCSNLWFVKVDTLGEIIWQLEVPRKGCDQLKDMILTEDNGIMFTGITDGRIRHEEKGDRNYWSDAFVGKLDPYGRLEWMRNYGGSRKDQAASICRGSFDEYFVVGGTHSRDLDLSKNLGQSDIWFFEIDQRGNPYQHLNLGGKASDWAHSVSRCANGDLLLAGMSSSNDFLPSPLPNQRENGFVLRMNSEGKIQWLQSFASPLGAYFTEVKESFDGRIVLCGNYRQRDSQRDFWFLRLTADGKQIQEHVWASPNDQWLLCQDICPDSSGFILGGYSRHQARTEAYAKGGEDFWLIRIDQRGEVVWRDTYGGPADEKCVDVIAYAPGIFYALGQKRNRFENGNKTLDYWLIRIEEKSAEAIKAEIYIRTKDNRIDRETPTRFRARCAFGERFLWDFGDGTTSTEKDPIKSYRLPGLYDVTLTVFVNDHCQQTVGLDQELEVW